MDFSCREASGPAFLVSEATKMPVRKPSAYITAGRKNNEKGLLWLSDRPRPRWRSQAPKESAAVQRARFVWKLWSIEGNRVGSGGGVALQLSRLFTSFHFLFVRRAF